MAQSNCTVGGNWLDDGSYQAILYESKMIAFEYDPVVKNQRVSPFIGKYIAGNYDGRLLSEVMVQDGVIHPADLAKSLAFREDVMAGKLGEMVIRLRTPNGDYRWFRMVMTRPLSGTRPVFVGVLEDVDAQMQYHELLRRRAEYDPISGLYTRETFLDRTSKLLNAEPDSTHFLLFFDIDRFKLLNKRFGNAEGDKVLRHMGDTLRALSLPGETFGRLGSDMFAFCVGRSHEEVIALVDCIMEGMQAYPLAFRFFLPTGISEIPPGCTESIHELCDRAVLAQHTIKGNYLCRYSFYEPYMGEELDREHELILAMEPALAQGQFMANFQPKYDMRSGRIIGAEALARWQHPIRGMVTPDQFIPLFERNGLIIKLDEYIWEQVCLTLRDWLDRGLTPIPISVNVSRMHLYNRNFCQRIIDLCDRYRIPRALLELEITESAYTECPQELFPVMDILQQAGFIFSMDDFGSGYSSLNMLKDIPVNIVKFDLRFLSESRKGPHAGQSILKHIIQLMKDLDITVLAEGVETEEQVRFLQETDCHFAQGFFYARPMPKAQLEQLLN